MVSPILQWKRDGTNTGDGVYHLFPKTELPQKPM